MIPVIKKGLALLITGVFLAACSGPKSQSADELLKDPEKREEIMTAISNDHQMMSNMMDHMMKNDHAMQMMKGDKAMKNTMMQHMMKMMQNDSAMCRMMGEMMMKNERTKGMMMDMMKKNGMNDNEMMEKNEKDHESHH